MIYSRMSCTTSLWMSVRPEVSAGMARQFLDALSGRGGNAGNGILRQSLGWTEAEYEETKKILTIDSHIKPGKVGSVIFI